MILNAPFEISARLLPAVRIGNVTISLTYSGRTEDGRTRYRYYIDGPALEHTGDDLSSGVGRHGLQEGFESLLSFLGSPENCFPSDVVEWAEQFSDEISMLQTVIEETSNLIEE
jgi:hypothetical protein